MNYDTTMERMIRSSDAALKVQTAKAQQLERALKDAEARLAETQRQLATVEQQLARMYGDLDDKDRELADALAATTAATDLLEQAQAQNAATSAQLNAALAVVIAARQFREDFTYDDKTKTADQWADNPYLYNDLIALRDAISSYDAAQQAQANTSHEGEQ